MADEKPDNPAIYLLRHGQTEWSLAGRHTGSTDVPLTGEGEQQARRAGRVLSALRGTDVPPALVLTSPRLRAVHTASLAGLTVPEPTEDLAEWDYGDYEGLTTQEIREQVPQWTVWSHPIPNGETAEQVTERARRVLDRAKARLPIGDVVLIGHGHFSRALAACWVGMDAADGVRFALEAAAITALGSERGEHQLRFANVPALPQFEA